MFWEDEDFRFHVAKCFSLIPKKAIKLHVCNIEFQISENVLHNYASSFNDIIS